MYFCIGGLENAILLYEESQKYHFLYRGPENAIGVGFFCMWVIFCNMVKFKHFLNEWGLKFFIGKGVKF